MTTLDASLTINGERLWKSLMDLAQIGKTAKDGVCRLALTDLDKQGRDLVVGWAREAGLSIEIDQIGNVFMRRPGRDPNRAPIMSGSHIDTQPTGGKFDGNYGVLAGLEVVRTYGDWMVPGLAYRVFREVLKRGLGVRLPLHPQGPRAWSAGWESLRGWLRGQRWALHTCHVIGTVGRRR